MWLAYALLVSGPRERRVRAVPAQLEIQRAAVLELAKVPEAEARAREFFAAGQLALRRGDHGASRLALERLRTMRKQLEEAYEVPIVSRPGEQSGVWRIPDANSRARNYYLIVEAVAPNGETVEQPITSEENGKTRPVLRRGLRVVEDVFQRWPPTKRTTGSSSTAGSP